MIARYWRAFWVALRMTLRGEVAAPPPPDPLETWRVETLAVLDALLRVADAAGYDAERRATLRVRIDGRDTRMETILQAVRFHLVQEYPHLMQHTGDAPRTAVYATNLNDHYAVSQLIKALEGEGIVRMTVRLAEQLESIPNDNKTQT